MGLFSILNSKMPKYIKNDASSPEMFQESQLEGYYFGYGTSNSFQILLCYLLIQKYDNLWISSSLDET